MDKGIKISKRAAKALMALSAVAAIGFILACASAPREVKQEPGWYGITSGWNDWGGDINGEVGHSLYVSNPRAKCLPSRKWSANSSVISGTLPPGLTFGNLDEITGIPTERGHWIVKLKLGNIRCEGGTYKDFEQELRFHITGSGKVVQ